MEIHYVAIKDTYKNGETYLNMLAEIPASVLPFNKFIDSYRFTEQSTIVSDSITHVIHIAAYEGEFERTTNGGLLTPPVIIKLTETDDVVVQSEQKDRMEVTNIPGIGDIIGEPKSLSNEPRSYLGATIELDGKPYVMLHVRLRHTPAFAMEPRAFIIAGSDDEPYAVYIDNDAVIFNKQNFAGVTVTLRYPNVAANPSYVDALERFRQTYEAGSYSKKDETIEIGEETLNLIVSPVITDFK